jgi:Lon protease-like protein
MTETDGRWIPLFPLPLVLFPGTLLPLHIFEPRYRAMVARCEAEGIPFAVMLAKDEQLAKTGCEAWIDRILQHYPDGQCDLMSRGGDRIILLELREHTDGYLEGKVAAVQDLPDSVDLEARRDLLDIYAEFRRLAEEESEPVPGDAGEPERGENPLFTFALAPQTRLNLEEQQALLEMLSERERGEFLLRHLAQLLPVARQANESRRRVRGNGKLKPVG